MGEEQNRAGFLPGPGRTEQLFQVRPDFESGQADPAGTGLVPGRSSFRAVPAATERGLEKLAAGIRYSLDIAESNNSTSARRNSTLTKL